MADGINSADLRERARVDSLRLAPSTGRGAPDPVDDALATKRKVIAANILDMTASDTETERLKGELERTKTEIELAKLKGGEKSDPTTAAGAEWVGFLMGRLEVAEQRAAAAQEGVAEAQRELLQQQIGLLREELARVQARPTEPLTPPKSTTAQTIEAIDEAEQLLARIRPAPATGPASALADLSVELSFRKFRLINETEREKMRIEHEDNRYRLERELALAERKAAADIAAANARSQAEARFFTETGPKLLESVLAIAERLGLNLNLGAAPAAPAPAVAPTAAAHVAPNNPPLPPGVVGFACQNCGLPMYAQRDAAQAVCQACGMVHVNDEVPQPSPSAPAPTPAPMPAPTPLRRTVAPQPSSQEVPNVPELSESPL